MSGPEAGEVREVAAATLKRWLHDGGEIALFDVREAGQFGEGHLFYAVPLSYSRLECEVGRLAPRPGVRMVLCDDASGVAARAARRLAGRGYADLHVLAGGVQAWEAAGLVLFKGVNVPSKTFGELVEHVAGTPRISARDLAELRARGERVTVLDGRPWEEYRNTTIPGSICCPNGELAYRIGRLVPDPDTVVVVNCAGRTRSIIGAETLRELGLANPVYALENGTQGWRLAGLALERGADRRYPDAGADDLDARREAAQGLARRVGVETVTAAQVADWLRDPSRTTYVFDVRTEAEFRAGTVPGAQHAPGGQLIQATDQWVGVRGSRVVLVDAEGVRAPVVASWLGRMGWEVFVLAEGSAAAIPGLAERAAGPDLPALPTISPQALRQSPGAQVIDLRPSAAYRASHIPGSVWSIRPRIGRAVTDPQAPVAILADNPCVARAAALDLRELGVEAVYLLEGGVEAWVASGGTLASSPDRPADAERIDHLFFVHDRHEGNDEAARRYLAWETNLVNQIDAEERRGFGI